MAPLPPTRQFFVRDFSSQRLPGRCTVIMGTAYFGCNLGVLVVKDAATGDNLLAALFAQETPALYHAALHELHKHHCQVEAIVCGERSGLFGASSASGAFGAIPTQMCHFHQECIVRRHLTHSPKHPAAKALLTLTHALPRVKESDFTAALAAWEHTWDTTLNEHTPATEAECADCAHPVDETPFVERAPSSVKGECDPHAHLHLRDAHQSLKKHLPWLFTFLRHPALAIPNTTNQLDAHLAELKNDLRNHPALPPQPRLQHILHHLAPILVRDLRPSGPQGS